MQQAYDFMKAARTEAPADSASCADEDLPGIALMDSLLQRYVEPLTDASAGEFFAELEAGLEQLLSTGDLLEVELQRDGNFEASLILHQLKTDPAAAIDAFTERDELQKASPFAVQALKIFSSDAARPELMRPILERSPNLFTQQYLAGAKSWAEQNARAGAVARLKNDPKSREKEFIKTRWQAWMRGEIEFASNEAFADAMTLEVKRLKCNYTTVNGWIRDWRKEPPT